LDDLLALGFTTMPEQHAHAVTVPGAVAGWHDLLTKHGTMTLKDVLVDAIHYAREGYPVHPVFGASWAASEDYLRQCLNTEDYLPNGAAPKVGQIVRLPGLANTLQMIADGGPEAFYSGPIADTIVSTLQGAGGKMTYEDLRQHRSTWGEPISTDYRGIEVFEHPPNGQGLAALQALNVASGWDLGAMAWDSPERLHLMVEAMRLAFADARQYIADMETNPAPVQALLSKEYAAQRRALVSTSKAMQPPEYGRPVASSNTVYLCAVDGQGNACSFINSLYEGWGSGIVAKGTGVFLQNRGANFTLEAGHPNVLAGGKRPYHTIIPGMALKDGELWCSFGVMGGFMQPQGHFQVMSAMIDDDLNPQEALNRPRFRLDAGTADSILALEDGIPAETMKRLAALGHRIRAVSGRERGAFGDGQIIRRDAETGVLFGGSDPRKDGLTAAF
jgi:gamma-glutamyltranspeptidase/glutathione hydrolase